MNKEYDTLILSGGGLKGFSILGSLQYLYDNENMQNIKKYVGCSVGTIISVLLILGYQPNEILSEFISNQSLDDVNINIIQGIQGKGFLDFDEITSIFEHMVKKKTGKIINLSELEERYKCKLLSIAYNYSDRCECIISTETFPDISVLSLIRMSSNVPFIFDIFNYRNKKYLDGFLISNFPLHLLEKTDTAIGISTCQKSSTSSFSRWDFFWNVLMIPLNELQKVKNKESNDTCDVITLNVENYFSIHNFKGYSTLVDMFTTGYTCATNQRNFVNKDNK